MNRYRAFVLILSGFCFVALGGAVLSCVSGSTFPDSSGSGAGGSHGHAAGVGGELNLAGSTSGDVGAGGDMSWDGLPVTDVDCSKPTQYIYLVSTERVLWRFWPPTLELTKVGLLHCKDPNSIEGPFSMSVDRHGKAWILYRSGRVHKLDLESGNCIDSGHEPPAIEGKFSLFGMAFTTDATSPDKETLFVRDGQWYEPGQEPAARTLGRFDVQSKIITPIGDNPGGNADLSGTGEGRLYAFRKQPGSGAAELAEINPATAANLSVTPLENLTIANAWAVAAWGGDVWMFTDEATLSTKIIRYQPATGQLDVVKMDIGPRIIGAGVSSCVPIVPPK